MSAHYGKFIAYFRVSTDRQGKSGLGLAAQREAVMSYLDGGRWAQHEREIISARTSAALKAAKARGKRLGNPKLSEARKDATAARKESADRFSTNVLPVIREIQRSGIKSLPDIARALAARGIPTARGGVWTPVQVSAIIQRARN